MSSRIEYNCNPITPPAPEEANNDDGLTDAAATAIAPALMNVLRDVFINISFLSGLLIS